MIGNTPTTIPPFSSRRKPHAPSTPATQEQDRSEVARRVPTHHDEPPLYTQPAPAVSIQPFLELLDTASEESDPLSRRIDAILAASTAKPAKRVIPDIIPGRKPSLRNYALPQEIEDLFRDFCYVPYNRLVPSFIESPITEKDPASLALIDSSEELSISVGAWHMAAKKAIERTQHHWGQERAESLAAHHEVVEMVHLTYTWPIAVRYDIFMRKAVEFDPSLDISILCKEALSDISFRLTLELCQKRGTAQKRPAYGNLQDGQNGGSSKKRMKLDSVPTCFRCGNAGHLPSACRTSSTVAGKPCLDLYGGKGKNTLSTASGKPVCFNWSSSSSCKYSRCTSEHVCSICRDSSHGALKCAAVPGRS